MKNTRFLPVLLMAYALLGCGSAEDNIKKESPPAVSAATVETPKVTKKMKAKYLEYYLNDYSAGHEFAEFVMESFGLNYELYYAMLGRNSAFHQIATACLNDGYLTYTPAGGIDADDPYEPRSLNKTEALKNCIQVKANEPLSFKVMLNNSILSTGLDFENENTRQLIIAAEKDHILTVGEYLKITSSVMDSVHSGPPKHES